MTLTRENYTYRRLLQDSLIAGDDRGSSITTRHDILVRKSTREELYYSSEIQYMRKTTRELRGVPCKALGNTRECATRECQV